MSPLLKYFYHFDHRLLVDVKKGVIMMLKNGLQFANKARITEETIAKSHTRTLCMWVWLFRIASAGECNWHMNGVGGWGGGHCHPKFQRHQVKKEIHQPKCYCMPIFMCSFVANWLLFFAYNTEKDLHQVWVPLTWSIAIEQTSYYLLPALTGNLCSWFCSTPTDYPQHFPHKMVSFMFLPQLRLQWQPSPLRMSPLIPITRLYLLVTQWLLWEPRCKA